MRGWKLWMCAAGLAVMVAAPWLCAQNFAAQTRHSSAPVADRFVSTPGQRVISPGPTISPTPGVIAPFHSPVSAQPQPFEGQLQPGEAEFPGVFPPRRHHSTHKSRPEYGIPEYAVPEYAVPEYAVPEYAVPEQYAAPNAVSGGYETANGLARKSANAGGQSRMMASPEASSLVSAPSGNRPPYLGEESAAEAPSPAPNAVQSREPVLTVVMKNGKRRKVRNYALTSRTLIDLDQAASGREVKIPLSRINLAATKKAAAQAGLSFAVPTN